MTTIKLNKRQSEVIQEIISHVKRNSSWNVELISALENNEETICKKYLNQKIQEWNHKLNFSIKHPEHKTSNESWQRLVISELSENL